MHAKTHFLLEMLDDLWWTDNWIDPLGPLLDDWPKALATEPYAPKLFSVEEIVNHTAFWEEFARRQLTGEPHEELGQLDDAAWGHAPAWVPPWPRAGDHFLHVRAGLKRALLQIDPKMLPKKPATDVLTREARVYTRAIHAGYHAGQLSLLRRLHGLPLGKPQGGETVVVAGEPFDGAVDMLADMMDSAWKSGFSINPCETLLAQTEAGHATWRPSPQLPSTTEIVNHMAFWENYATLRLQGRSASGLPKVAHGQTPPGMPDWPDAAESLIKGHQQLRAALRALDDDALGRPCPGQSKALEDGHTAQWLVQGIVVHHAYHIGQLVLMRPLAGLDA